VLTSLGSANRDPAVFGPTADQLDLRRADFRITDIELGANRTMNVRLVASHLPATPSWNQYDHDFSVVSRSIGMVFRTTTARV
jgi:hypothetical protein